MGNSMGAGRRHRHRGRLEAGRTSEAASSRGPYCPMSSQLALYSTMYPGVERFLSPWYESVLAQTDRNFDLYIGADQIEPRAVFDAVGTEFEAVWVSAPTNSTPASV